MDFLEFFPIIERDLEVQNPMPPGTLDLIATACDLQDGQRLLDVGCGKASLLRRWLGLRQVHGTGLELNPAFLREARELAERQGVQDRLRLIEGPADAFKPAPGSYDVVSCIGATFALGGFDESLAWMREAVKPEGAIVIADCFLTEALSADRAGVPDDIAGLPSLAAYLHGFERQGLTVTALYPSSTGDWDRYVSSQWTAAWSWAAENPDHPHRTWLLEQVAADRRSYLRHGRRYRGWAVWVLRGDPA